LFHYIFHTGIDLIGIPLYETMRRAILNPFILDLAELPQNEKLGFVSYTRKVLHETRAHAFGDPALFTGWRIGGLLASKMADDTDQKAVSFESIEYSGSLIAHASRGTGRSERVNIFSGNVFYATSDSGANVNVKYPLVLNELMNCPDPMQIFCMFSAGCVSSDIYDGICSKILPGGFDEYIKYFDHWNRPRVI
jgi:hypothetical protein